MARAPFGFDARSHERHHWWRSVVFKLLPGVAITALLWWWLGGVLAIVLGVVVAVRYVGLALAPDLIALGETVGRSLRGAAFREVQGRFYQFKGHRIRVTDDELLRQRWVALDDLATALGAPMPAVLLRRRWPQGLRQQADGLYVLDDVALAWLGEQRDARAGRLRHWVERDVWYPVRGPAARRLQGGAPASTPPPDDR